MFTDQFAAVVKTLKLKVLDDQTRFCEVAVEMPWRAELAYGIPRGDSTTKALVNREYMQVKMSLDADAYDVTVVNATQSAVLKGCRFTEAVLTAQEDKKTGEVDVFLKLTMAFRWDDSQLLFLAHGMCQRLDWVAAPQQQSLKLASA